MPELPDVEVARRYLESTSLRQRIDGAWAEPGARELHNISAPALERGLTGRLITAARRHGKHLLAALDDGQWLVLHFGMTGYVRYYQDQAKEPDYTRLRLDFAGGYHLAYSSARRLGRMGLIKDPAAYVRANDLGPDALELDAEEFVEMMRGRRGMIKAALMDQALLAGVGNVYSDEALFQAGIHPKARAAGLARGDLRRLHQALRRVLRTAIDRGAEPDRLPRRWLTPSRHGQEAACPDCSGQVQKITVAGRSGRWCPACQRTGAP